MKKKEIMKRTGCTKKQAKYLKQQLKNYPNTKKIFYDNVDKIDLTDVDELKVCKVYGGFCKNEVVNVVAFRVTEEILGIKIKCMTKYCLSTIGGDHISIESF